MGEPLVIPLLPCCSPLTTVGQGRPAHGDSLEGQVLEGSPGALGPRRVSWVTEPIESGQAPQGRCVGPGLAVMREGLITKVWGGTSEHACLGNQSRGYRVGGVWQ